MQEIGKLSHFKYQTIGRLSHFVNPFFCIFAPIKQNNNDRQKGFGVQAIQVSYDISAEKTRKREIKGLLLAAELTKCDNLLLLTDHESGATEKSGHQIRIQPVYEWSIENEQQ